MRVAVEPYDELHRTLCGAAATAGPGNFGFPIGRVVVKPTEGLAAFGDGRPGRLGAGCMGDETTGGDRHPAMLRGFSLRHAETARSLCRHTGFVEILRLGFRR